MFPDFSPATNTKPWLSTTTPRGERKTALRTGIIQLLEANTEECFIPTNMGEFSYISCDGNKLYYTSDTEAVTCCDMNGKPIWSFEDSSVLRSPRGVAVDNQGFV
jgi:hypothetical protein